MKPILTVLLLLALVGCQPEKPTTGSQEPAGSVAGPVPPPPSDDSLALAGIYQLQQQAAGERSVGALQLLDSMRCQSDGFVTEALDEAAAEVWNRQFTLTLRYLEQHPKSCLRQSVVRGLSAAMFAADDQTQALAHFHQTSLDSARRAGLSTPEMVFLHQLTAEVNPARLD
ncbi:hypothetical protein [Hymenobacter persicinus]|uniref:Uncharacterized protein n=1 Tax=Hymenobacter persicinus TaxID=2025506 RepID=A0A4V1ZA78_9BACT|nr:hypothetical protein [Hymenobacter persicinus]RYU74783.1 hypothetical protein EWM57_20205 [Hymenobacter persicinus]